MMHAASAYNQYVLYLLNMRTTFTLSLQRGQLQPILTFLSGSAGGELPELDEKANELIRGPESLKEHTPARRRALALLVRRIQERVVRARIGSVLVGKEFLDHAARQELEPAHATRAWWEMWHFLHWYSPGIGEGISACPWCGRFFARYHRNDKYCSSICGLYRQLFGSGSSRSNAVAATRLIEMSDFLDRFEKQRRRQFGKRDQRLVALSRKVHKMLVFPVLGKWTEPFAFPEDVTDPSAFLVIWGFVFGQSVELSDRMQICGVCKKLYWRKDRRMKVCSVGVSFSDTANGVGRGHRPPERSRLAAARVDEPDVRH